jgi:hypothetical protein
LENLITSVLRAVSRIVLLAFGLVFVASLVLAAAFVFALWSLHSFWARLRGQPVVHRTFQFNPRAQWGRFYADGHTAPTDKSASVQRASQGAIPDIMDVVPKESKTDDGTATARKSS